MNEEKRINGGYEIIESCTIGSNELVIGHNTCNRVSLFLYKGIPNRDAF